MPYTQQELAMQDNISKLLADYPQQTLHTVLKTTDQGKRH